MNFKSLDKNEFKKLFPVTPNVDLSKKYDVTESTIRMWAAKLKLRKKSWGWTKEEEQYLLKSYPNLMAIELAKTLKRSRWSVINKYRELKGLREQK